MKLELKGYLFCRSYGGKPEFELLPWDCRTWDATSVDGRVFVKEHLTTVEVPDDFDPRPQQVAALEAEKQKARADFQARITEIDRQIQSLMAIEGGDMTKHNNGGPAAFPGIRIEAGDNYSPPKQFHRSGMSLRDYFAAKAMPLAFQYWRECTNGVDGSFVFARMEDEGEMDLIAADCYAMADAMLKAREPACT